MELGYWEPKGLGEPIRWAALALGVQVTEKNPANDEEWALWKKSLPTDFPNLPYLIDGDFTITESSALPIYLAHKAGKPEFLGKDLKERAVVRQLEGVIDDIKNKLFDVAFDSETPDQSCAKLLTPDGQIAAKLGYLNKFLGDKEFFLDTLTWADLLFAYTAQLFNALAASFGHKSIITQYANLQGLFDRIHGHSVLKARIESAMDLPYIPPEMMTFKLL